MHWKTTDHIVFKSESKQSETDEVDRAQEKEQKNNLTEFFIH